MFGDVSPNQTASSLAQGLQRSNTQIQHIYTRLHQILKRLRVTMLETAQYIASTDPTTQISYTNPKGSREIFEVSTKGFLLHNLDIYVESNISDADTLMNIKNNARVNNTLGANTLEMATLENAKSVPEIFEKLEMLDAKKQKELQEERQFQQQQQQQALAKQEQIVDKQLAEQKAREEREHEKDIQVAQIRAVGYGEGSSDEISKEIIELQNANQRQREFYDKQRYQDSLLSLKEREINQRQDRDGIRDSLEEKIKIKQLEQKDKELDIREKEVIARNKRTKAID